MKLLKKLTAVMALVAVCGTMIVPVTVNAAVRVCPPHRYEEKNVREQIIYAYSHAYAYYMDMDNDGIDEVVVDSCTVTSIEKTYDMECICGSVQYDQYIYIDEIHSDAGRCDNSVG